MNRPILSIKGNPIFWGWYVVFGTFAIMVITYGVRYSFGVFVKPMFAEYHWPMTIIQLGASINLIMYALSSILAGRLLDRFAPRGIMIAGILLTSAGLLLASQVRTPLGLYLSYGVLVGAGTAGCGMVVNSVTVAKWFNRYRGLAIGISSMGIGIGTMLMAPLASYIVKHLGWRSGFLSIGMLMVIVGILITWTLMGKSGPEQMGLLPDGDKPAGGSVSVPAPGSPPEKTSLKPILETSQFWILVICNVLAVMTVMMTFNCQIAYAINRGINDLEAAAALGIVGVTGSCGKLFFGWFCDRVRDAKYSAATGFIIMAVGMMFLFKAETVATLYIFALIYGFGYGSLAPVMPYMISDRFDRRVFGSAYGLLIFFANGVGGSIGPVLGGYIFDTTGSYGPGWLICIVILIVVSALILTLKPKSLAIESKG
ncbi:MAG: MFS transporter [Thermodesulfobacteriota bacterium]